MRRRRTTGRMLYTVHDLEMLRACVNRQGESARRKPLRSKLNMLGIYLAGLMAWIEWNYIRKPRGGRENWELPVLLTLPFLLATLLSLRKPKIR